MITVWLVLLLTCLTVEMLITAGEMTALTLAVGAFGGLLAAVLMLPFWLQGVAWGGTSLIAMVFLRPLLRRHFLPAEEDFTAGSYAGQIGKVVEAVDAHTKGRVQIHGEVWLAESDAAIPAGTEVVIVEVDGATLKVLPADELRVQPHAFPLNEHTKSISEGEP